MEWLRSGRRRRQRRKGGGRRKVATSASVAAAIKRTERPVLIVGSELRHLDWALDLAKKQGILIVATAQVAGAIA